MIDRKIQRKGRMERQNKEMVRGRETERGYTVPGGESGR